MSTTNAPARPRAPGAAERLPAAAARAAPASPPKRSRTGAPRLQAEGVSRDARRLAAAILEVLAGVRTPTEAAQQLAISLTRYDIDEGRALQGLVAACEPRPRGRVRTPETELVSVRRECEQLRRQCARQQALVRVTQRSIGLVPAAAPAAKPDRAGVKKRRQRKPTARALKAAAVLQGAEVVTPVPTPASDMGMSR
jgi:hypothetical protein